MDTKRTLQNLVITAVFGLLVVFAPTLTGTLLAYALFALLVFLLIAAVVRGLTG